MATIEAEPPEKPRWLIGVYEDERQYLLAALDFAQMFLAAIGDRQAVSDAWPLPAAAYRQFCREFEQVVALPGAPGERPAW